MSEKEDARRICVTVGMRLNLGNYESADASICLSGIEANAPEAEIQEMLDTSKIAFGMIKNKLRDEINKVREEIRNVNR